MSDADLVFVLLFAIAAFYVGWSQLKIRRLQRAITAAKAAPPLPAVEESQELKQLRQRVHVLERIAVEKEDTLSREIEGLRGR